MKHFFSTSLISIACIICMQCNSQKEIFSPDKPLISLRAGGSWGGVVEETTVDGISGATNLSWHTGAHVEFYFNRNSIESGLDFIQYRQQISYNIPANQMEGRLDLNLSELRVPLTYNFRLLSSPVNENLLNLKLGVSAGFLVGEDAGISGTVPEYSVSGSNFGPTFGLSSTPVLLNNKQKLGLYIDFYRGSKVFDDMFHDASDTGGFSNLKFGLSFTF